MWTHARDERFRPAARSGEALAGLSLRGVLALARQLIDLLKQSLGALNCLLALTDLLHEKFSPGADHVVSLWAELLSVFHVSHPLSSNFPMEIRFTGSRSI